MQLSKCKIHKIIVGRQPDLVMLDEQISNLKYIYIIIK